MLSKPLTTLSSALVCALSLLATAALAQTTIQVGPGQTYATIQSGIDTANIGDTVLVSPGIYNENINFNGKAITVTSSGGPTVTTIDGGNKPGLATVAFDHGETSTSVISGFTIRGGGDAILTGTSDGGIYVNSASPTIQGNTITANYCHNIDVEYGSSTILNNEVSGVLQSAVTTGPNQSRCFMGSGIFLGWTSGYSASGPTVIGNLIQNNLTGSGINMWAAQNVLIMDNTIRNNTSSLFGSAFTSANSEGTLIAQNLIYNNTSSCGGALQFENSGPGVYTLSVLVANNTIVDNVMTQTLFGDSACAYIAQIYPSAYSYGLSGPGIVVINNIISGSTPYPAVNCSWFNTPSEADQPTFENNILYNAGGSFFGSYCVDVSAKYNNIAADPQFVNASGDFHLKSTSPAIDSGENSVQQTFLTMTGMAWAKDAGGNPRVQDATGNGCVIDIGAYEYSGTVNSCGISETLTSSLNPALAGQTVTFTAQLSTGSGTPTGQIQFLDGGSLLSTQPISGTGSATFSTNSLTVGNHTITANYQPTGSFGASTASLIQVINADSTSTALTCLPNPIDINGTAQLTATVTSAHSTPTGSISFTDNGAALATQGLLNGTTSLAYTGSIAGTHTITATYSPTGAFAASSAICSEVVNALPTISTLAVAPAISTYGSAVTLTATVSAATLPAPSTPTGVVTFYNGASAIGTGTLTGGVATLVPGSLPGGSHTLTCMYSGSSIYATSNCNSIPVVVNAAPTALTISSSRNPAPALSPVTFTARLTVNGQSAGAGNAIRLSINGQSINLTTDATGSASYTISTLAPNSYPVTATFTATNNFSASSASLIEVITIAPTTIGLTGRPNPGFLGQPVTLAANVSSQATSTPVGSGSVTFFDGSTSLGSVQVTADGSASLTPSFSVLGVHNITAVYSGDVNFSGSNSAVLKETIVLGDFSISVLPGAATVYTGEAVAVRVSITSLQGFSQSLALTCTQLPANATCSFNPALIAAGQGTSILTIKTAAPHQVGPTAGMRAPSNGLPTHGTGRTVPAVILAGMMLLLLPRRFRMRGLTMAMLAMCTLLGVASCGAPAPIAGGTPPGSYKIAVTADYSVPGVQLEHSAQIALTVKSLF